MTPDHNQKLGHLFETYSMELIRFAYGRTKNWHVAEDLVQRTFEIACLKEEVLDTNRNVKTWLLNILIFEIKNYWRAADTHRKHIEQLNSDKEYEYSDSRAQFDNMDYIRPSNISKENFDIVIYMAVYGFSCSETAKLFGISEAACYKRYQRTKEKMKNFL